MHQAPRLARTAKIAFYDDGKKIFAPKPAVWYNYAVVVVPIIDGQIHYHNYYSYHVITKLQNHVSISETGPVGPDLAIFRHMGKISKVLGCFCRFSWQNIETALAHFYAIGKIFSEWPNIEQIF